MQQIKISHQKHNIFIGILSATEAFYYPWPPITVPNKIKIQNCTVNLFTHILSLKASYKPELPVSLTAEKTLNNIVSGKFAICGDKLNVMVIDQGTCIYNAQLALLKAEKSS